MSVVIEASANTESFGVYACRFPLLITPNSENAKIIAVEKKKMLFFHRNLPISIYVLRQF